MSCEVLHLDSRQKSHNVQRSINDLLVKSEEATWPQLYELCKHARHELLWRNVDAYLKIEKDIEDWHHLSSRRLFSSYGDWYYAIQVLPSRVFLGLSNNFFAVPSVKAFAQLVREGFLQGMAEPKLALSFLEQEQRRVLGNIGLLLAIADENKTAAECVHLFRQSFLRLIPQGHGNDSLYPIQEQPESQTQLLCHLLAKATQQKFYDQSLNKFQLPSWKVRSWVPIVGAVACFLVIRRAAKSINFFAMITEQAIELQETVKRFLLDYVWKPIQAIHSTIRYNSKEFSVQSKASLHSDVDSLSRMVVAFAHEELKLSPEQLANLSASVADGDISVVLRSFEGDIKTPIKSMLFGTMLRSVFIQIQKTKVDVELAMSALDKIMRANELTFHLISSIPTLLILTFVWNFGTSYFASRSFLTGSTARAVIARQVHQLHRSVTRTALPSDEAERLKNEAIVFISLVGLQRSLADAHQAKVIRKSANLQMKQDLSDLGESFKIRDSNAVLPLRLSIIERIISLTLPHV